jgi:hypothetical protein
LSEQPEQIPDLGEPVTVAWIEDGRHVDYNFFHSWTQLLGYDQGNHARVWQGGFIDIRCGTDGLPEARNKAVAEFLAGDKANWLMWLDTDMGFQPDVVDRLLEVADPVKRPVVGALCFASIEGEVDGFGGWKTTAMPTIFDWAHDNGADGFAARFNYPADAVVQCAGTGSACVLIHRSVFERIRDKFGPAWYARTRNPSTGQLISEDLSFCVRANALSLPVFVHTGVKTTHAKPMWLGEELYWRQRAVTAAPWTPDRPAPAKTWTVPRYAIIPTHNRPARLLALVASLGTQCDHVIIVDNASTPPVDAEKLRPAAGGATVEVIRDEEQPPNLARLWNVMLDYCLRWARGGDCTPDARLEPYDVAVLNDDSVIPAGWYNACSAGLRGHDTAVVAHTTPTSPALLTELHNDPNNRMTPHAFVMRGETHLRADEDMRWWYFDTDLDWRARQAGGVLSVDGPRVVNALANTTTCGALAEQAEKDRATFEAKWSR